jgi:hypothetical protein
VILRRREKFMKKLILTGLVALLVWRQSSRWLRRAAAARLAEA